MLALLHYKPVLESEHGGPVLLCPLVPLAVVEPAPALLCLASYHDEHRTSFLVLLQVRPEPSNAYINYNSVITVFLNQIISKSKKGLI